jgi:ribokinase
MSGRVVVVGSINADLVARVADLPSPGETVTGAAFERHHGGKGGNQAVAAARLGVPTVFIGAVGDDPFGPEARAALRAERIDVSNVVIAPQAQTGVALILVDNAGENMIAVASGSNAMLDPAGVRQALERIGLGREDVVLVCHEIPTMTVRTALRTAVEAGARSVLNPAPAIGLGLDTVGEATFVTPNRTELETLIGREGADPDTAAAELFERLQRFGRADAIVVTLGPGGALVVERHGGGSRNRGVSAPAVRAVDTTGAGDAFNGVLAASLADGLELHESVERAVIAAALSTTKAGAREGMPTRTELEERLVER